MKSLNNGIFEFLLDLKSNNNREWFNENKAKFIEHQNTIKTFALDIEKSLNNSDQIEKVKVFRIYRDVRFSKDKSPFKTNFGIAFLRKKPYLHGGYYIHITPGGCFIASGIWDPSNNDLLRIRKEIEFNGDEMNKVVCHNNIKNYWGPLKGDEVKTSPKGFSKDDPNINLLRKKQFVFMKSFKDNHVTRKSFEEEVVKHFEVVRPFLDFISDVLTTDLNGESII